MKKFKREYKHKRVREKVVGTSAKPRVAVFRSIQHIYAQVVDDSKRQTLLSESDLKIVGPKREKATKVGEALAVRLLSKKITEVVFDRGGFKYHGRVASLAEGLRKGGVKV